MPNILSRANNLALFDLTNDLHKIYTYIYICIVWAYAEHLVQGD